VDLILDTDTLTLYEKGHARLGERIREHRARSHEDIVCTTVITLQEQMRGRLASLNRVQPPARLLTGYAELLETLRTFRALPVRPFSAAALAEFERLRRDGVRIGTLDLRIASIALAAVEALVITRNLRDFGLVPGLTAEDWTI